MKKLFLLLIITFAITINTSTTEKIGNISNSEIKVIEHLDFLKLKEQNRKTLNKFLKSIGFNESGNDWKRYNKYGYIGRFQFGKLALIDVGYGHINYKEFKSNPKVFPHEDQVDAMIKYMKINERRLEKTIRKYEGKIIKGIKVTKSGILAAAHLGGSGGIKKFLRSNGQKDAKDANNTHISQYLRDYGGHNFNLKLV